MIEWIMSFVLLLGAAPTNNSNVNIDQPIVQQGSDVGG